MHFVNKHHKVSFSYYFIFDRIVCVLVTFWERGHFVMLIIKSLHLINLHFWTYLLTILDFWRFLVNIVICSLFCRVEDNRLDLLLKGTSAVKASWS